MKALMESRSTALFSL